MCKKSEGRPLTWPQMKHAILRNFGGLESETLDPFKEFEERLHMPVEDLKQEDYSDPKVFVLACGTVTTYIDDLTLRMRLCYSCRFGVL